MFNKVILIGTIGKNPVIKEVGNTHVANFSIATWDSKKDENGKWIRDTTWHNVAVWGKSAVFMDKFMQGDLVMVEGKIMNKVYKCETNETLKNTVIIGNARLIKKRKTEDSDDMPTSGKYAETTHENTSNDYDADDFVF